jgi:hypothetical protein
MARRRLAIATILFTAAVLPASARADTIRITGGSLIVDVVDSNKLGTVDVVGTQGFSTQLRLGLNTTGGPWQCCPADPGTAIRVSASFDSSDGSGTVAFRGQSFEVGGLNPNTRRL